MTDLEICQNAKILPIKDIAKKLNIKEDDLFCYGKNIAKVEIDNLKEKDSNVILVTAISPTPAGEGKSTITIGLADALNALNKKVCIALREPSLGPVLGMKGGACGGGYSQVIPMTDINLHFTGDMHAVTTAHNTIASIIDNHIYQGNELNIDHEKIIFNRVIDLCDRSLRNVVVGLGGKTNGIVRESNFDITAASEIMAILCLSNNLDDFKKRVGCIVIGYDINNKEVTVNDLGCSGAIALIMKDAIKPNLVQTLEHTPVLIHGGPFANIAHGCNSVIATKTAMSLSDYVVTEAGFGADLGAEKFFNIKCSSSNIKPKAAVIVATVRALKMHGGVKKTELSNENVDALLKGIVNLERHINNIKKFNVSYVIAVNKFITDTDNEINALLKWGNDNNHEISLVTSYLDGSSGSIDLANKVLNVIDNNKLSFNTLYNNNDSIKDKIIKVCTQIYNAKNVEFSSRALLQLTGFTKRGWDKLPICIAKTQFSFSDNPKLLGAPNDFTITIKELHPSIGAGFIVVKTSDILTMPGLGKECAALKMDIINNDIKGLF